VLSYSRQNVNCESIGLGEVTGFEIDSGFHEIGYECDIARQPIELGYDEGRAMKSAGGESSSKLRAGIVSPTLDLGELGN
jgi:hypothetical protein